MRILEGDSLNVLKTLPEKSINMCMTSPPYWALRDYGVKGQLGLEPTFDEYINNLCDIFDEVKRVLRDDGTLWVNLGDTYYGGGNNRGYNSPISKIQAGNRGSLGQVQMKWDNSYKAKCLVMIPFRFAIEMVNRGWILRNTIIWHKNNCMPHSVKDRFTVDFEYLFFFSKNKNYYFKQQLEKAKWKEEKRAGLGRLHYRGKRQGQKGTGQENFVHIVDMRNKRTTWTINPKPFKEAHFATYPKKLCETPISAGCPPGGIVLDPFMGSGTTGIVALEQGKDFIGIELNKEYIEIAKKRINVEQQRISQFLRNYSNKPTEDNK